MKRFQNKKILVTGSNQGIGAACAIKLATEGADLIIHGIERDDRAEEVLAKIHASGSRAIFLAADLNHSSQAIELINEAESVFGELDILVNNAGMEKRQDFTDITEADYDQIMNVNLKSIFF